MRGDGRFIHFPFSLLLQRPMKNWRDLSCYGCCFPELHDIGERNFEIWCHKATFHYDAFKSLCMLSECIRQNRVDAMCNLFFLIALTSGLTVIWWKCHNFDMISNLGKVQQLWYDQFRVSFLPCFPHTRHSLQSRGFCLLVDKSGLQQQGSSPLDGVVVLLLSFRFIPPHMLPMVLRAKARYPCSWGPE